MIFQVCDTCKILPKVPADRCFSCAYGEERDKRMALESSLNNLLALLKGMTSQVQSQVDEVLRGNINPAELARLSSAIKQLPDASSS